MESYAPSNPASGKKSWLEFFKPAPPAAVMITEAATIRRDMLNWQIKIMIGTLVGYALFYFVRKNLSSAMAGPTGMLAALGITKAQFGLFLTMHGLVYGFSKFINGFIADRANAAKFMTVALLLSAGANIAFGFSTTIWLLGTIWVLNGWFQGMGFPPIARLMTHWFSPKELATKMSFWNTSHSIGAGLVALMCGALVKIDWRLCFWVPAALAIAFAIFLPMLLRDTPQSVGLPEVKGTEKAEEKPTEKIHESAEAKKSRELRGKIGVSLAILGGVVALSWFAFPSSSVVTIANEQLPQRLIALVAGLSVALIGGVVYAYSQPPTFAMTHVFRNKYIWLLALANFFVYVIRFGIFDWGMILLTETKKMDVLEAGMVLMGFEFAGVIGMLISGWLTDKIFGGRCARTCLFAMAFTGLSIFVFWVTPLTSPGLSVTAFCFSGFFIYAPQALIGIASANLATKRAAATAVGFTGLFGYLSTLVSGVGFGWLVHKHGWNAGLELLIGCAVIGTVLFAMAWGAKASGYADDGAAPAK